MSEQRPGRDGTPLRVAIVGAGPSGFYAAEALQRQDELTVEIDMIDRLATPFGLVRGGVAPDHQKIKSVTKAYDRIAAHTGFRFLGNVEFGHDLTRDDLRAYHHAIIYAVGAPSDWRLGIPGDHLPGSYGAAEFVGWYNGHPDFVRRGFDLSQPAVAVVGNGNVAMDVARMLAADPSDLAETDMASHARAALAASAVREIHILGRRGPAQAAFTLKEIRELGALADVAVVVDPADLEFDPVTRRWMDENPDGQRDKILDVLSGYADARRDGARRAIVFHFLVSPVAVAGDGRVGEVELVGNELELDGEGVPRPRATDRRERLEVGALFRAVGYRGVALGDVPFDGRTGVIPNRQGRVLDQNGASPGEYCVGWIKRGPSGVIGSNKPDAVETVACLVDDLAAGRLDRPAPPRSVFADLVAERTRVVSYADWQRIDAHERARGEAASRPREKFCSTAEMLELLDASG